MVKRTPLIDKDDPQLCLDDGLLKYAYYIVVTNSNGSARLSRGSLRSENAALTGVEREKYAEAAAGQAVSVRT